MAGVLLILAAGAGCTGKAVTVKPDPQSVPSAVTKQFDALGVKERPSDRVYPPAGNLTAGFANAVERSGISDKVFYPLRPDDDVDATLDSKFDVIFDPHTGSGMVKAFFTGFTLFLLEPLFWYDYDYVLTGNVDVSRPSGSRLTLNATSAATMSMKFLSLSEAQTLEGEALGRAKDSLYKQLLNQLGQKGQAPAAAP